MNVEFQAHRLQKAHANLVEAKEANDEMSIECAEREIEIRMNILKREGFKVFADEHDVMLLS